MGSIYLNNIRYGGLSGPPEGDQVYVDPKLNQGIKIAEITVNDTTDSLYAPGGVSDVEVDGTSVVNQQGIAEIDLTSKQDNLTAGSNITITNNTISATDTTYNDFSGADGTDAGSQGLVPAPSATDNNKFLKGDGTWDAISAGSSVIVTPTLSTGTKIADYSIDGTPGSLYAPSGGGGGGGSTVTITPSISTGTKIADYSIDGVSGELYAPSGGGSGANVIEKTQAQYDALTQAEKENGSIYMVKSTNTILTELTEPQIRTSTKVTASSYMVDSAHAQYHYPFGAFNRVSPTTWAYPEPGVTTETTWCPNVSEDGSNYSWIQYEFDAPVNMASMKIWAFSDYSGDTTKSFIIEGSNDGTTFTNILANGESSCDITATLNQNYENIIDLDNTNAYTYVRLRSLEPMGASYQPTMFIDEIFVYGYDTVSINKIYYMDTEYANTNNGGESGGGSSSNTNITTYETTITTSEYGWWNVTDENGAILDPSQYIIVDITCKMDGNIGPYYGCKWLYNTNYDGSNNKSYTMTLENINDGGFIRYSNTVTLQVSYTEIQ